METKKEIIMVEEKIDKENKYRFELFNLIKKSICTEMDDSELSLMDELLLKDDISNEDLLKKIIGKK